MKARVRKWLSFLTGGGKTRRKVEGTLWRIQGGHQIGKVWYRDGTAGVGFFLHVGNRGSAWRVEGELLTLDSRMKVYGFGRNVNWSFCDDF